MTTTTKRRPQVRRGRPPAWQANQAQRAAVTAKATWFPAVLERACRAAHADAEAVMSTDRAQESIRARRIIMGVARELGMSTPAIGALLGRDHTTVLYGLRALDTQGPLVRDRAYALDLAAAIFRRAA